MMHTEIEYRQKLLEGINYEKSQKIFQKKGHRSYSIDGKFLRTILFDKIHFIKIYYPLLNFSEIFLILETLIIIQFHDRNMFKI